MKTTKISERLRSVHLAGRPDAPSLILLHSLGLDHRLWLPVCSALAGDFQLIAPDLPGHGALADKARLSSISIAADHVLKLMDELNIAAAAVMGLSMGGAVAQQLALRRPERVSHLILAATMPKGVPAFIERAEAAERDGLHKQIETTLTRWFTPEMVSEETPAVAYARDVLFKTEVGNWACAWRALANHDAIEGLKSLNMPTLCIAGSLDPSTPPALLQSIAAAMPQASYVEIEGAPHLVALTHPDALADAIRAFVALR